jgi:hypothetical protein
MSERVICTLCGRQGHHDTKDCPLRHPADASYNEPSKPTKGNQSEDKDQEGEIIEGFL